MNALPSGKRPGRRKPSPLTPGGRMRRSLLSALAVCAALALLVPTAAIADEGRSRPAGAIPVDGGGYAVELGAPRPDWYTPKLHRRVLAAGAQGVPLPQ